MKKIIIKKYNNLNNLSQECANQIISTVKNKKKITLVLPGGKSPKQLIKNLHKRNLPSNIKLILSDERLTSNKNKQNLEMLKNNFPSYNKKNLISIFDKKRISNFSIYNKALPKVIDICVLGIGEDGHVASLFEKEIQHSVSSRLVIVKKKEEDYFRLSLSLDYISSSKKIILLVNNKKKLNIVLKKKSKILNKIIKKHDKVIECFAFSR
ncbi:6-phosphogluconolactonase [Pelagibacteraceae bacterium]|nr:6-phosphogluconolactonase [Pelagibacteraceae bacterium]MDC0413130.1 6-phosphogluconolactonase [Pelagibacteraceae bacterium]